MSWKKERGDNGLFLPEINPFLFQLRQTKDQTAFLSFSNHDTMRFLSFQATSFRCEGRFRWPKGGEGVMDWGTDAMGKAKGKSSFIFSLRFSSRRLGRRPWRSTQGHQLP